MKGTSGGISVDGIGLCGRLNEGTGAEDKADGDEEVVPTWVRSEFTMEKIQCILFEILFTFVC